MRCGDRPRIYNGLCVGPSETQAVELVNGRAAIKLHIKNLFIIFAFKSVDVIVVEIKSNYSLVGRLRSATTYYINGSMMSAADGWRTAIESLGSMGYSPS